MNVVPNKQLLINVPFQSTKSGKKELCVDNKVRETIGDVYCPSCRNEKGVYKSTNITTSFYDCKKCKACCNVLNIPFKDQKPTILLFGGDGTHCFAKRTSRDCEKEKPSPFLKKFLRQSQQSTSELEPKKVKMSPKMEKTYPSHIGRWFERHIHFSNHFNQFQSIVNRSSTYIQLTENYDLLSLQRRNPVDSRFWSRLCYYCSKWSRPKISKQLTRNTHSSLAIAVVSKTRLFEPSSSPSSNYSQTTRNIWNERRSTLQCGGSRLRHQ